MPKLDLYTHRHQFERVKRYYRRFHDFHEGIASLGVPGTDPFDDVVSFFVHCHHLKDWLKNDPSFSKADEIESFVNNTPVLVIVADIANGAKHLTRSVKSRSGAQPRIDEQNLVLELGPGLKQGKPDFRVRIEVFFEHGGRRIDAFDIATEAVDAWSAFLGQKQ